MQDQLAQKYAATLGDAGRALAAGWFRSWRNWLERKRAADAMAKKYVNLPSTVGFEFGRVGHVGIWLVVRQVIS